MKSLSITGAQSGVKPDIPRSSVACPDHIALSGGALFCPSFSLQHQRWLLSEVIPDTQYSFRICLKVTIKTAVYFCLH